MIRLDVTAGDLLDRITILELKVRRCPPGGRRSRLTATLAGARQAWRVARLRSPALPPLTRELREINAALWTAEDQIRAREQRADFGAAFVAVARDICRLNDRRSALKAAIDRLCGFAPVEGKRYRTPPVRNRQRAPQSP